MEEILRLIAAYETGPRPQNAEAADADEAFIHRAKIRSPALVMDHWIHHFEWREVLKRSEIEGHILDFGCGSGHSDIMLGRHGRKITGIDLSPLGIDIASYLLLKEPKEVIERVNFVQADIRTLEPLDQFDSVWSSHVFEHIKDPAEIFEALKKWTKPGAHILISVPYGKAYDCPRHVHHWNTAMEARKFFGDFIMVTNVSYSPVHHVIRLVGKL